LKKGWVFIIGLSVFLILGTVFIDFFVHFVSLVVFGVLLAELSEGLVRKEDLKR
jgi:hypothetical protein